MSDNELWTLLRAVAPKARDDLRRVLIRRPGRPRRDLLTPMRYRDQNGQDWADIIDFLTMWPGNRTMGWLGALWLPSIRGMA